MSLTLKVKKLARMKPQELLFRAREHFSIQQERRRYPQELREVREENFNFFAPEREELLSRLRSGDLEAFLAGTAMRTLPIPLDQRRCELFKSLWPGQVKKSLQRADAFVRHHFSYMGITFDQPGEIAWQCDPRSGEPWPTGFYRDIRIFRDDNVTDIKHVWELNRLQFFIELAKAYALTGKSIYGDELDRLVAHWYESNPYKTGVAWTSALESAVRIFSLLWTLNFYLTAPKQNPRTVFLIIKLLWLNASHIEDNLSIYFSPYNHLIGEVAALFAVGYLFPDFRHAERWRDTAWHILADQVEKQFHPDGATVEQATFYHHFTLGFYLQCMQFRRLNGDAVPENMAQRCEQALDFARKLTRPDGTLPWIGDIDAARSLYFSEPAHWDFRGFQAIGAALFGRPDMKALAGGLREEALWLLSDADIEAFQALPAQSDDSRFIVLPDSGYTIMRSGADEQAHFSLFDCGPIAHGLFADATPSAAHGHADLLAIELAPFGESLLIDPGFSNYRGGIEWHSYFRSTAAHNTLTLDGESQLVQVGVLSWSHEPRHALLQHYQGSFAVGVCGEHSGFQRLAGRAVHRRTFLFVDELFWLTWDLLIPGEPNPDRREVGLHFHFPEHATVQQHGEHTGFAVLGKTTALDILIFPVAEAMPGLAVHKGGEEPAQGWISPTYRDRRPAPVAEAVLDTTLPVAVLTLYVPGRKDGAMPECRRHGREIHLTAGERHYLIELPDGIAGNEVLPAKLTREQHGASRTVLLAGAGAGGNGHSRQQPITEPD